MEVMSNVKKSDWDGHDSKLKIISNKSLLLR